MPPKTKRRKTKRKKRTQNPVILVPLADRALTGGNFLRKIHDAVTMKSANKPYEERKQELVRKAWDGISNFLRKEVRGGLVYDPMEARVREFMERGHRPIKVRTFPFERKWHGNYIEL